MTTNQNLNRDLNKKEKEEIKLEVISKTNKREGLCKDCVRAESCSLSHNTQDVIWDCEDYDNQEIITRTAETEKSDLFRSETKQQKSATTNPGLCAYCKYSENCSLKSIEGGIWHCAEYA